MNFMNFMNMSTLRKWFQIISNRVMYGSAKTCLHGHLIVMSKFSKRCLQRTDATRCREVPRCKFQSETFEAVKAFERKTTYFHRTDAPWVWSLCANGRLERRWHTSKWCWNVTSSNFKCFILQALNYVCIYMVQNCTWHLFHQSKGVQTQGRCSPFFPFFPSRCHPETAETAEALNRRALGGKHNSDSSGDVSVHEQPTLQQGKLRPGWGLWGERWPSWTFHQGIRPDFFSFRKIVGLIWINEWMWMDYFHRSGELLMQIS